MSDHCASFLVPSVKQMSFPSQQERTTFLDVPPAGDPALRWPTEGVGAARQSHWANLLRESDFSLQLHKGNVVPEAAAPAAITWVTDEKLYAQVTDWWLLQVVWAEPNHRSWHFRLWIPERTQK